MVGRGAAPRGRRTRTPAVPRARDRRAVGRRRTRVAGGGGGGGGGRAAARDEARDIALAVTAGGLVAGAGVLATVAGPRPIHVETSRDGYLRRAGLDTQLIDAYRERFRLRAARYVQWISVPLAVAGTTTADGFLLRFLISWLVVMAIGIPVGYVTGWLPPDRLVTFGFAVPIAAALGLVWVHRRLGARPWLARALVVVLAGWMIVGALLAWGRQKPFISAREAGLARTAFILSTYAPKGDPVVFVVNDADATATFLGSRAANILRAAADPDRAADIYVFVGTVSDYFADRPTVRGDPEYDALSRLTLADIPREPLSLIFVLAPFYRGGDPGSDPRLIEHEPGLWVSESLPEFSVRYVSRPLDFGPSSPFGISLATIAILALLAVLGIGFALVVFDDTVTAIATAPAFGAGALTLTAVALDLLGLRLAELPVALAASALAGLGGFALLLVTKRKRDRQAPA
jgi:hypothetical protein